MRRALGDVGGRALVTLAVAGAGVTACAAILGIEDRKVGASLDGATDPKKPDGDMTSGDDDDTSVTLDGGKKCDPNAAFGAPVPLDGVTTAEAEGTARLSDDELTITYDAVRAAVFDSGDNRHHIYTATRGSRSEAFQPPSLLKGPGLSLADEEYSGTIESGGLALLFERFSFSVNKSVIYVSHRGTKDGDFGAAVSVLPAISGDQSNPFFRGSLAQGFWFAQPADDVASDAGAPDSGDGGPASTDTRFRIHLAQMAGTDSYTAQVVAGIAGVKDDYYPVISADGLTLYFGTNRATSDNKIEIWSIRRKAGGPFESPQVVANVNRPSYDNAPSWISPDDCRLYLFRSLNGDPSTQDILVAERPQP